MRAETRVAESGDAMRDGIGVSHHARWPKSVREARTKIDHCAEAVLAVEDVEARVAAATRGVHDNLLAWRLAHGHEGD